MTIDINALCNCQNEQDGVVFGVLYITPMGGKEKRVAHPSRCFTCGKNREEDRWAFIQCSQPRATP